MVITYTTLGVIFKRFCSNHQKKGISNHTKGLPITFTMCYNKRTNTDQMNQGTRLNVTF